MVQKNTVSQLQAARLSSEPQLPKILQKIERLQAVVKNPIPLKTSELNSIFPKTYLQPVYEFIENNGHHKPLNVGVVLSGGQAAGGHNVIGGLFDALKRLNPKSRLFGFKDGPIGIINGDSIEITSELLAPYRNQGGFDLLGSGRDKIESDEAFKKALSSVSSLNLEGLVIVGGDDSNTNAAFLAEYFLAHNQACSVIGVPKTIDGDLKNDYIETSFGFDTACKIYSEAIGNIARDALSAGKYYFFIKVMGRSASHIALECALQTQPNFTLIGEEIQDKSQTLGQIVSELADLICQRAEIGKNYGVILIPEGVIEFIPEIKKLIKELNRQLASQTEIQLPPELQTLYQSLPFEIQKQLVQERDPHGNVQVSKIETERLLLEMVSEELKRRKKDRKYLGKFNAQPLFFGYEGRSGMPSNFDANYCYALGQTAALLIQAEATGVMAVVTNLSDTVSNWGIAGVPLVPMMVMEERKGKQTPVIQKALIELKGEPFMTFANKRQKWKTEDHYLTPGPIQFYGPSELSDAITWTLKSRHASQQRVGTKY